MRIDPQLAPVRVDRSVLRRVFVNLLTNAICFGRIGSAITVAGCGQDGFQQVSVSDQGPGIAPEHHALIFQQSGRIESGQKGTYFSTGLVTISAAPNSSASLARGLSG